MLSESIIKALSPLIGLPMWRGGRAVNLIWFEFGSRVSFIDERGDARIVGDYAIHLQCSWRLTNKRTLFVASRDMYEPRTDRPIVDDAFNWSSPGRTYCDEQLENLFVNYKDSLIVTHVQADDFGGFELWLQHDFKLAVFLDISLAVEGWRFLEPSKLSADFVMTGKGVEL